MKLKVLLVGLIIIIFLFIPIWPVTTVPAWKLKIEDVNGSPVVDEEVIQYWKHYSFEFYSVMPNEDVGYTDAMGVIVFPKRELRISIIIFFLGKFIESIPVISDKFGVGPNSFVVCRRRSCSSVSYSGQELPTVVVAN